MSNRYGPRIVTDGLVLCLDAADRNSYPLSGDIWTDLSGNGNNGTITGATFNGGNNGSFSFDGNADYVDFTDSNLLPINGLTICVWFKTSVTNKWLLDKSNGGTTSGWFLAGGSLGPIYFGLNSSITNTPTSINNGLWTNIIATWTPSTSLILYKDGEQVSINTTSIPSSINNPLANLRLGGRKTNADWWNGNISNVSIYSHPLSADEIRQNYNATKGRFGL